MGFRQKARLAARSLRGKEFLGDSAHKEIRGFFRCIADRTLLASCSLCSRSRNRDTSHFDRNAVCIISADIVNSGNYIRKSKIVVEFLAFL